MVWRSAVEPGGSVIASRFSGAHPVAASSGGAIGPRLDLIALGVLLIAGFFPATPPTVPELLNGTGAPFWNFRLGPANVFELLVVVLASAWLVKSLVLADRASAFDRILAAGALLLLSAQSLALARNFGDAEFLTLDIERIAVLVSAYFIVTRTINSRANLRFFIYALGVLLCVQAAYLVMVYGIPGRTELGTITGREALLATEDSLLLIIPAVFAWGRVVDGRAGLAGLTGAIVLLAAIAAVDLLSLRRGALLMIGAALLARSLPAGRRRLAQGAVVCLIGLAAVVALGPGRGLVSDVGYLAESAFLQSDDSSTDQRTSEISSFFDNMDGLDWITGSGIGVTWVASPTSPVDSLSFGSGESAVDRIGWHVYGLDWAYKFGIAGIAILLVMIVSMGKRLLLAYRRADAELRSITLSTAICAVPLFLLAFTNIRLALFAGMFLGLLSKCCDLAGDREAIRPTRDL